MFALVLGLLLGAPDAGTPPRAQPAQGSQLMHARELVGRAGQTVTVVGLAADAKGGAVVVVDGSPVYLRGVDSWPSSARNQRVEVTGTLRSEKLIPSPTVDAKGAVSQGAEGDQLVLDKATWRVL